VQQSFPIALGRASAGAEETLRRHAEPARKLKDAGCDLVIWPETMLPTGLNVEAAGADIAALSPEDARDLALKLMGPRACDVYYEAVREGPLPGAAGGREDDARTRGYKLALLHHLRQGHALGSGGREPPLKDYLAEMESLTRLIGCPILAGGGTLHRNPSPLDKDDRWVQRNSALWFDPDANSAGDALPSDRQRYSKVHLVPFSEYVPFKDGWPWFHRLLRWFVPAEMPQLAAGEEYRLMELRRRVRPSPATTEKAEGDRAARTWRIAAPICYEGTFDYECRRMVYQDGRKAADILANLSNDGWFVWKWWPERGSNEHSQHLVQYCFRAVENRVPVVRAVNTGISASVDSDGRIRAVVEQYGVRTAVGGVLVLDGAVASDGLPLPGHGPRVLVDGRVSVYSRVGDVFAVMVSLAAAALAGWMVWKRRQSKEGARK
jgi:apolipoprotein N-acyltransferase